MINDFFFICLIGYASFFVGTKQESIGEYLKIKFYF